MKGYRVWRGSGSEGSTGEEETRTRRSRGVVGKPSAHNMVESIAWVPMWKSFKVILNLAPQYHSPALSPPQSPPTTTHGMRCLRGKADFAGSAEFLANTAFAARAAIAVVAVRWRRRCGRGGASRARHPHATLDRFPHPPHPPRGRQLDSPDHLPPSPAMAPASPNYLTRNAWCLRTHPGFSARPLRDPPRV